MLIKEKVLTLIAMVRTSGVGGEAWKFANYADMTSKGIELSLRFSEYRKGKDFKLDI